MGEMHRFVTTKQQQQAARHVQITVHFTYSSLCTSRTVYSELHVQFTVHFTELQNCNGSFT